MLNVAKVAKDSKIYGPGIRTVIWFQGCSIRCPGCINPDLIPFRKNQLFTTEKLLSLVTNQAITLLGGEPLDQPDIYEFLLASKMAGKPVVLFSGYEWNDLVRKQQEIISNTCEFAILGPFVKEKQDPSLYLRGSSNQIIKYFSKRLSQPVNRIEAYELIIDESIEVRGRVNKDIFDILEK